MALWQLERPGRVRTFSQRVRRINCKLLPFRAYALAFIRIRACAQLDRDIDRELLCIAAARTGMRIDRSRSCRRRSRRNINNNPSQRISTLQRFRPETPCGNIDIANRAVNPYLYRSRQFQPQILSATFPAVWAKQRARARGPHTEKFHG